jgi:hypothetical protein
MQNEVFCVSKKNIHDYHITGYETFRNLEGGIVAF